MLLCSCINLYVCRSTVVLSCPGLEITYTGLIMMINDVTYVVYDVLNFCTRILFTDFLVEFFDFLNQQWDRDLVEARYIKDLEENLRVIHLRFGYGSKPLFKNREFIVYERRETMDDGTLVIIFIPNMVFLFFFFWEGEGLLVVYAKFNGSTCSTSIS